MGMFGQCAAGRLGLVAMVVAGLGAGPALAQSGLTSAYTDLNLDADCLVLDADDFGATWSCPGYKGYPLRVQEGDLRFSLSYGFDPDANSVGFQTLPPFNHLGEKLEWRLSNASGRWMPVATIVRFFTADVETGEDKGQVLVVSKVAPGEFCHVAYVDALANKDANQMARDAADKAEAFDCATDEPKVIGEFTAY